MKRVGIRPKVKQYYQLHISEHSRQFFSLSIQIRQEKQARQAGMSEQSLFFLPNRALPLLIQGNSKTTRFLSS